MSKSCRLALRKPHFLESFLPTFAPNLWLTDKKKHQKNTKKRHFSKISRKKQQKTPGPGQGGSPKHPPIKQAWTHFSRKFDKLSKSSFSKNPILQLSTKNIKNGKKQAKNDIIRLIDEMRPLVKGKNTHFHKNPKNPQKWEKTLFLDPPRIPIGQNPFKSGSRMA